jgi:hypothetical protein
MSNRQISIVLEETVAEKTSIVQPPLGRLQQVRPLLWGAVAGKRFPTCQLQVLQIETSPNNSNIRNESPVDPSPQPSGRQKKSSLVQTPYNRVHNDEDIPMSSGGRLDAGRRHTVHKESDPEAILGSYCRCKEGLSMKDRDT